MTINKKNVSPVLQRTALAVAISASSHAMAISLPSCDATISGTSTNDYCLASGTDTVTITGSGTQTGIYVDGSSTGVHLNISGLLKGDYPLQVYGGATGTAVNVTSGGKFRPLMESVLYSLTATWMAR